MNWGSPMVNEWSSDTENTWGRNPQQPVTTHLGQQASQANFQQGFTQPTSSGLNGVQSGMMGGQQTNPLSTQGMTGLGGQNGMQTTSMGQSLNPQSGQNSLINGMQSGLNGMTGGQSALNGMTQGRPGMNQNQGMGGLGQSANPLGNAMQSGLNGQSQNPLANGMNGQSSSMQSGMNNGQTGKFPGQGNFMQGKFFKNEHLPKTIFDIFKNQE